MGFYWNLCRFAAKSVIRTVLPQFTRFHVEKNWAQKYICGEKMTNMSSVNTCNKIFDLCKFATSISNIAFVVAFGQIFLLLFKIFCKFYSVSLCLVMACWIFLFLWSPLSLLILLYLVGDDPELDLRGDVGLRPQQGLIQYSSVSRLCQVGLGLLYWGQQNTCDWFICSAIDSFVLSLKKSHLHWWGIVCYIGFPWGESWRAKTWADSKTPTRNPLSDFSASFGFPPHSRLQLHPGNPCTHPHLALYHLQWIDN